MIKTFLFIIIITHLEWTHRSGGETGGGRDPVPDIKQFLCQLSARLHPPETCRNGGISSVTAPPARKMYHKTLNVSRYSVTFCNKPGRSSPAGWLERAVLRRLRSFGFSPDADFPIVRKAEMCYTATVQAPPRRQTCGYGGIGRHDGFRFHWETVQVQVLLPAPHRRGRCTVRGGLFVKARFHAGRSISLKRGSVP